jgi:hypothetical protein
MKNLSFILVHIGQEFPNYINDCIEQIKKFNTCDIYLAINDMHRKKIIDKTVILVPIETLKITPEHYFFNANTTLDRNFRGGFWKYTTERFFIIEEVISKFNLLNIFHIENDNLIYFNVEDYLQIFEENYEIAAIFDNDLRSIPGFIYFKSYCDISYLNHFINNEIFSNDMELLANFRDKTNHVQNLPILPPYYDLEFKSKVGHITQNKGQYFNNFDKFNSIFDGAAIGQYLGGIDPRNPNSSNSVNFVNESCLFDSSKFIFEFVVDDENRKDVK